MARSAAYGVVAGEHRNESAGDRGTGRQTLYQYLKKTASQRFLGFPDKQQRKK
jgi:hypothetical protein